MPFVPYVPSQQPVSPRAQELSRRLSEVVENYRLQHPDLRAREIQDAVRLALQGTGASGQSVAVMVGVMLAVLGVLAAFYVRGGSGGGPSPTIFIAVAIVVFGIVVAILKNRR